MRLRLAVGVLLTIFVLLIGALFGVLGLVIKEEPVMNTPEYTGAFKQYLDEAHEAGAVVTFTDRGVIITPDPVIVNGTTIHQSQTYILDNGAVITPMPTVGPQYRPTQEEEAPPKELTPPPGPPDDWEGDVPGIHDKTPETCVYYGMCIPLDAEGVQKWNEANPGQRGYSCPGHARCHISNKEHALGCFEMGEDGRVVPRANHGSGCGAHCREQCCKCCGSP